MNIFSSPAWNIKLKRGGSDRPYQFGYYKQYATPELIHDINTLIRYESGLPQYGIARQLRNLRN